MSTAKIVINQTGVSSGIADKSRDDLVTGLVVNLSNADDEGVRSWRWRFIDIPDGSSATISNPLSPNPTFTPDIEGSYFLELIVDDGLDGQISKRIAAIRELIGGENVRFPAAGEGDEANWDISGSPNEKGYHPDLMQLLRVGATGSVSTADWKNSVRVASVANIDLSTALAAGSTVDTITVALNDRVLVKNQTVPAENGLYGVPLSGAASRTADADDSTEVTNGLTVVVGEGTQAGSIWTLTTSDPITVGVTGLTFSKQVTQSWSTILSAGGATTSGTNPIISTGDQLEFEDGGGKIFYQTGAPGGGLGNDGDLHIRQDAVTADDAIRFKVGGVWNVVAAGLAAVLSISNLMGANDIVASAGQGIRGIDAADATVTAMFARGGDYSGTGADDAGAMVTRGGDTTSANSGSNAGPWTGRGGNANGGLAGPFVLGGSTGDTATLSTLFGSDTTVNNPGGALEIGAGGSSGGGVPATLTLHGGEPVTSDSNSRPGGDIIGHGGDGGGRGLAGTHAGGNAIWRGGDGENFGKGGNASTIGGNSGAGANTDAGNVFNTGGTSTGNRHGGDVTNTGGAAAGSGDGGSIFNLPGTSGSGIAGTVVVGAITVAFTGNALNITGNGGQVLIYDVATDVTAKNGVILGHAFTNSEGPFVGYALSGVTASINAVSIGGGLAGTDAATLVNIYTAAAVDTDTGTLRASWTASGVFVQVGAATIGGTFGVTGLTTLSDDLTLSNATNPQISLTDTGNFLRHVTATNRLALGIDGTDRFFVSNAGVLVQGSCLPSGDNTRVLGQGGSRWANVHSVLGTFDGTMTLSGDLNHDGTNIGVFSATPVPQRSAYTRTATIVESRTLAANASATAANNNAVLASIIDDLQKLGFAA